MSNGYNAMKKNATYGILALFVVIIIFVVIFSGKKKEPKIEDISPTREEISSIAMQPVEKDIYTYQFEGIDWQFPQEGDGTRVNFMLKNFSRIEGAYVTFGNPYKLGVHQGDCHEVESLYFDKEKTPGIPVSYAECVAPDMTTQFILFQQGEEIVAKMRRMYKEIEGYEEPEFSTLYTINLTEIVE